MAMQQNQMLAHEEDELISSEASELEKTDEDDGPVCTSSIILKSRKPTNKSGLFDIVTNNLDHNGIGSRPKAEITSPVTV